MKVYMGKYPNNARWYNRWFNWYPEQRVYVKIDKWDTWSMDSTLAHLCVPMLKQLRDTSHSAPFVDFEDRPAWLVGTLPKNREITDEFHFESWDWVLGEMIFAFEAKLKDDYQHDLEHSERIRNGFALFGKYFENLWD
jgi:hypothetical protein